ncbi:MAG: haloacid dehalogenase-like hydrolase [Chloroflexi bacterium]|nr:haloacid dehalogenase-like hydrolase [Chloroflexota bacterium]
MIVVSDMMGTLTTGSPFLGLVDWIRHNQSRLRASWYMASITPSYLLAKRGIIDWQAWGQKLMIDSLAYIKNANPENVKHASEWAVEQNLWKKRREDVVARLVKHREDGAKVYIASSVVEPFIEPFARRIGAETIGTPVEIVNGRVRMVGKLVASEKKIEQVLSRLGVGPCGCCLWRYNFGCPSAGARRPPGGGLSRSEVEGHCAGARLGDHGRHAKLWVTRTDILGGVGVQTFRTHDRVEGDARQKPDLTGGLRA